MAQTKRKQVGRRPKVPGAPCTDLLQSRVPKTLADRVRKKAEREATTVSEWIRGLIEIHA